MIRTEIGIGIVIGGTGHAAEIVESDLDLDLKIEEIEKEVVHRRRVVVQEEESHLFIGMCHHQVLNTSLLYR